MIYFVRHAQTDDHINRIQTGTEDVPLNSVGIHQAEETALTLKDVSFDVCYCSPLKRTKQTLEQILKYHQGLKVIYDDRLIERFYGELQNKPINKNINKWRIGGADEKQTNILGLEPISEVVKRVSSFYDEVQSKYKDKNVLVISHGGVGRVSLAYFNGMPEDKDLSGLNYKVKNVEIVCFKTK